MAKTPEKLHKAFGEEFNPFQGLTRLLPLRGVLGRSRKFTLDRVIDGIVEIGGDVYVSGTDRVNLLTLVDNRVELRPVDLALGSLSIGLRVIKANAPLDITCRIRIGETVILGINNWAWEGIAEREEGGFFYQFVVPGKKEAFTELVVDTDLTRQTSTLHNMLFRFDVKRLPECLLGQDR